ncbi:pyridoxamine 5'-phosphate oxidase [Gammaproteobacteria bacterium 54_18_T64]|nr:pyridoxamine 5'-phosphate oxidase [Gammaproteobacteria bacterium 54_18_T64]
MADIYHPGNRELQDDFGTRPLADRVKELIIQPQIGDEEREFIHSLNMLFISSVDPDGQPTVSYKGGEVGFVRVLDPNTIAFPLYDGNGMFLSAGNIKASPNVGLLFIDFENPHRLRLHGRASVSADDELMDSYHEAQMIVRVAVDNIFINCPRYIHPTTSEEQSIYVPTQGKETPEPEWKSWDVISDVLPTKKPQ